MKVTVRQNDVARVIANVRRLTSTDVLVGIPGEAAPRDRKPGATAPEPTNPQIGFWMEYGIPEKNVPARAFLRPGVLNAQQSIIAQAGRGVRRALDLSTPDVDVAMEVMTRIGEIAASAVRAKMVAGPYVPLSERTLEDRAARGRRGAAQELANREAGMAPSSDLARPLNDSGALRQSLTFVLDFKR